MLNHLRIVVMKAFWPKLKPVPVPYSSWWISMPRNWRDGPRFVILNFSESLALTSIAALVASFAYNIEMLSMYQSIRIPSLWR